MDELFVGNRLEKGRIRMNGQDIDLKNVQGPVFVFASQGDNITPPQQALNWIPTVWKTVDEIRRQKRVIIYMVHETIGHLGIFVSGPISRKEHKEMISSIDQADLLAPGLYEMIISESDDPAMNQVHFEPRDMADIHALDDDVEDNFSFAAVATLSTSNDTFYRLFVRPFVQLAVNEASAETLRQLHPLRVSKRIFSDLNPWMQPVKTLAEDARKNRRAVTEDNPFIAGEKKVSAGISDTLDLVRDIRDLSQELWFQFVYGNPLLQYWFNGKKGNTNTGKDTCQGEWMEEMERGGFAEGIVRIMSALAHAGDSIDRSVLKTFQEISHRDERLSRLVSTELAHAVKKQACILASDPQQAINALATLLPEPADRQAALAIARGIFSKEEALEPDIQERMEAIQAVLGVIP